MPKGRKNRGGRRLTLRHLEYDLHVAAIYHNEIAGVEPIFDGEYELLVHDRLWGALPAPTAPTNPTIELRFRPHISLEEYLRRGSTKGK